MTSLDPPGGATALRRMRGNIDISSVRHQVVGSSGDVPAQVGSGSAETIDFPPRAESAGDLTGRDGAYAEPPVAAAGRTFEAPEQELGARPGHRRDALDIPRPISVAQVVEGAVVHQQVERSHARWECGQVALDKVDANRGQARRAPSLDKSSASEIDAGHGESLLGQIDGVGAGATAEVDRTARAQPAGLDHVPQLGAGPDLPRHAEEAVPGVVELSSNHRASFPCSDSIVK